MPVLTPPAYDYVAYLDEAGDPGTAKVFPIDPDGASEWMTMGVVLIDARHEPQVPTWTAKLRNELGIRRRPDIHFRDLRNHQKKLKACQLSAALPMTAFVLCSHKVNMRRHRNEAAERKYPTKQWFYNFCIRVILERVSEFVAARSLFQHGEKRFVKIVFSERGGHLYRHTETYSELLSIQGKQEALYLNKREIDWSVMHWQLMEPVSHKTSAGCQLADIVTSAFYLAADAHFPRKLWTTEYAEALQPIVAAEIENGERYQANHGVTLLPWYWRDRQRLSKEQRKIFSHYGYIF